jgi:molecular chaperone GrpE (heat shock protein)
MPYTISERAARAADILESIEELNRMIAFHRDESKDDSMRSQYEIMRQELLRELNDLLATYQIAVQNAA